MPGVARFLSFNRGYHVFVHVARLTTCERHGLLKVIDRRLTIHLFMILNRFIRGREMDALLITGLNAF